MGNYPGYGTTLTNSPTAILASSHGYIVINVTILSGEGVLEKGQVLGIDTSSEKYAKYDDTAGDGTQVAKAILADKIDASSGDKLVAVYIRGIFIVSKLTGYDAAALVDLNGRLVGKIGGGSNDILVI